MDSHRFRAFLVRLQDRLSDDDRKRLHFYLGDDVPRRIRDDPTLGGTLDALQTLFEKDHINENDSMFLINAFEEIQCFHAANLLKKHWRQNQDESSNQSIESLSLIFPSMINEMIEEEEEEDKYATTITRDFYQPEIYQPVRGTCPWKSILIFILLFIGTTTMVALFFVTNFIRNKESTKAFEQSARIIEQLTYDVNKLEKRGAPNYRTRWNSVGTRIAGQSFWTDNLNGFHYPVGIFVDQDRTLYVADSLNHRIVAWPIHHKASVRVAGSTDGSGDRSHQLNRPMTVIFDSEFEDLFICDFGNRRVVRWPRRQLHNHTRLFAPNMEGQIIIGNIECFGLAMDVQGYLYVADVAQHEVKRYDRDGNQQETSAVAGGHGRGNGLHQLDYPTYIFIDDQFTLYVSDSNNHRVMKWRRGDTTGIIVAGGKKQGTSLEHLAFPRGLWVDAWGNVYVVDQSNNRVMRWKEGVAKGTIIVGGKGQGANPNQLANPQGLFFDYLGNMFVSDYDNHRIQYFAAK